MCIYICKVPACTALPTLHHAQSILTIWSISPVVRCVIFALCL